MTYVDLNPVRARICYSLADSAHTSARTRLDLIAKDRVQVEQSLAPVLCVRGFGVLKLKQGDYLDPSTTLDARSTPASGAQFPARRRPRWRGSVTCKRNGNARFLPSARDTSGPLAPPRF